jgi:hypothetical protein
MNKNTTTSGKLITAVYASYGYVYFFAHLVNSARVYFHICWTGGLGCKGQ